MAEKKQKEDVETDTLKMKNQLDKIMDDNVKLRKETEIKDIHEKLDKKAFEEDEAIDKESSDVKVKLIDQLQAEKAQLFLVTEKNPRLQALREENENLQKSLKGSEKKLDDMSYKVLETETRQALSVKKKEEDQEIRKKLQAELEKWRDQFDETVKSNELKVERKLREAESAQIRELQAELIKQRHELNELKNKLANIYNKEKEYILDQANKVRYRDDLIKKRDINAKLKKDLEAEIVDLDPRVNDHEAVVEDLRIKVGIILYKKCLYNKLDIRF